MKTPHINRSRRWVSMVCLLSLLLVFPLGAAQFVDVTAEIEVTEWGLKSAKPYLWMVRYLVGTNSWQMEGDFSMNAKTTYWFTGTKIIENGVVTKELPEMVKFPFMGRAPLGAQTTQISDSVDGNPGFPVKKSDRLCALGRIAWLAFCSGPCLKREGRQIFPPRALWKEEIAARSGFPDRTTVFEDDLGLPRSVNLYTTNDQPVLQYRVTASTNALGWEFPMAFYLAQYRPAYVPDSYQFGTNGWELVLTAKGKVTAIGAGSRPQIPTELEKAAEK